MSLSTKFLALTLAFVLNACTHQDSLVDEVETGEAVAALETTAVCTGEELACGSVCVDANSDANNCGACGSVCASGICSWGVCADDRPGHVFVIGHGYEKKTNPAIDRLLANALSTSHQQLVNTLIYRGTNTTALAFGTQDAIVRGARQMGRSIRFPTMTASSTAAAAMLPSFDVLVIAAQPQMTDAQLAVVASDLALAIDDHVRRGGVVIALDAPSTKNSGTASVLGSLLQVRRTTTTPGAVAAVSEFHDTAVGSLPMSFAISTSVGYAPTEYTNAVTTESGDVLVAHRAFF
jgi:hypothetical protein